ncbi:hypothetical protein [Photobacterium leiognathi]|uniref:hypothetical protein n=1 Tax=Photobacterium leiognathi TaxID=553611 RepID=UPI0029828955|nr:hypothetical protein [Photobacterium leiognathi]
MDKLFNKKKREEQEPVRRFMPYHSIGLLEQTYSVANYSEGVACTMLCAATIEALFTDLEGFYSYCNENPIVFSGYPNRCPDNYLNDQEKELLKKLKDIAKGTGKDNQREDNKDAKRQESITVLRNLAVFGEWDRNDKLYQDYRLLVQIRNGLTHIKSEELIVDPKTNNYHGCPKYLNNLLQKKIVTKPKQVSSWIDWLNTQEYCLWCQDITHGIVMRIISMLPESNLSKHLKDDFDLNFDKNEQRDIYANLLVEKQKEREEFKQLKLENEMLKEKLKGLQEAAACN